MQELRQKTDPLQSNLMVPRLLLHSALLKSYPNTSRWEKSENSVISPFPVLYNGNAKYDRRYDGRDA